MSVKIRLQRHGRAKAPFYHIVIADSRAPRDGKFIEKIGTYNPMTKPATIDINRDLAYDWLTKGAQPTDTVRAILRFKGVMLRKHLMRGVAKGSMTEAQAMVTYNSWIDSKEKNISDTAAKTQADKKAFHEKVFGKAKAKPVVVAPIVEAIAPVVVEAAPVVVEAIAPVVVEAAPVVVEAIAPVIVEEAPVVVEAVAPVVIEEAPVVVEAIAPVVVETVVYEETATPVVAETVAEVEEIAAPVVVSETETTRTIVFDTPDVTSVIVDDQPGGIVKITRTFTNEGDIDPELANLPEA